MRVMAVVSDEPRAGHGVLAQRLAAAWPAAGRRRPAVVVGIAPARTAPAEAPGEPWLVAADGPALRLQLEALHGEGVGLAILDLPPAADAALLAEVLAWADLALIPVLPTRARLARVGALVRRIEATGAPFAFVVNRAEPGRGFTGAYAMALAQHGTVCPVTIPADPPVAAGTGGAPGADAQGDDAPRDEAQGDEAQGDEAQGDESPTAPAGAAAALAALADFVDRLLARVTGGDADAAPARPAERRRFRRWSLDWEAVLERGEARHPCRLVDLSGGGAGFECAARLAEGDAISLVVPGLGRFAATVVAAYGGRVGARLALDAARQWQLAVALATRMRPADRNPAGADGDDRGEPTDRGEDEPGGRPAAAAPEAPPEAPIEPAPAAAPAPEAIPAPQVTADPAAADAACRLRRLNRALTVANRGGAPGRVIVVGNEKGGSGKSTVAVHLLIGLLKEGFDVAAIDLDGRQATLSRYLANRRRFAGAQAAPLPMPAVVRVPDDRMGDLDFSRFLTEASARHDFVVVDTPGRDARLGRLAHLFADLVVTPLNDSFLDLDVIARLDAGRHLAEPGPYGLLLAAARAERAARDGAPAWIVLRNRLSTVLARNKADMAAALDGLAPRLGFRVGPGLTERVVYRELFHNGLTLLDLRDGAAGVPLTLSHVAARQEVRSLLRLVLAGGDPPRQAPEPRPADPAAAAARGPAGDGRRRAGRAPVPQPPLGAAS